MQATENELKKKNQNRMELAPSTSQTWVMHVPLPSLLALPTHWLPEVNGHLVTRLNAQALGQ